jgi:methionyl-tRNA formyltransferase
MRLLFFGTPEVAVPFLEACAGSGHEVLAVVTQPDRPSGRGLDPTPPPIRRCAERLGLAVHQPKAPSELSERLRLAAPDLAVVVAYGRILKPELLCAARLGFLNVHFSLLPRYRGAAPVQWALLRGETRTGVTLFWLDAGLDTGPVERQAAVEIGPDEDAPALMERLIRLGVQELREALLEISEGRLRRQPQAGEPSLAPKIDPALARLSFAMPATELHNRVRGLRAGPRAFLRVSAARGRDLRVSVLSSSLESSAEDGQPGAVVRVEREKGVLIQCRPGRVWIREVQPEGKSPVLAADFLNGLRMKAGDRLGVH